MRVGSMKAWYQYPSDDFVLTPVKPQDRRDVIEVHRIDRHEGTANHACWRSNPYQPLCGLNWPLEPVPTSEKPTLSVLTCFGPTLSGLCSSDLAPPSG